MTRQCPWCGRPMGRVPPLDDARVSHGICPACEAAHLPAPGRGDPGGVPEPDPPPDTRRPG
jgi:hypothetical protein